MLQIFIFAQFLIKRIVLKKKDKQMYFLEPKHNNTLAECIISCAELIDLTCPAVKLKQCKTFFLKLHICDALKAHTTHHFNDRHE